MLSLKPIATVLVLFICIGILESKAQIPERERNSSPDPRLVLSLNLEKTEYCSDSKMRIYLRAVYSNLSEVPILLAKDSKLVWQYSISRTDVDEDSPITPLQKNIKPYYNLTKIINLKESPVRESYVLLSPGGSHTLSIKRTIPLNEDARDPEDGLDMGEYDLRITMGTWLYQPRWVEEYRKKWANEGYLWSSDVESEPMTFLVVPKEKRKILACN